MRSATHKPATAAALLALLALLAGLLMPPHTTAVAEPATRPTTQSVGGLKPYTETIPGSLVTFDLVPVPAGDGVGPLYFGRHEVTWDEFYYWALCKDMDRDTAKAQQRARKLRPSPPYIDIDRGFGLKDRPAIGLSRRAAELYCQWLSGKTGKIYRLPTRAEWQHAYRLAYGPLDRRLPAETLDRVAWHAKNAEEKTHAPGTKEPTPQGVCDLLGNAAEWVTGTGETPAVAGGGFRSYAREMTGDFLEPEDQSVWNEGDPSQPKSTWWYVDADYVGFRVVREPGTPR